jgi:hypothetical protein
MAVLVEALSVVVRRDAIAVRYAGGWDAFADTAAACWLADGPGPTASLATPEGWTFEGSLSQHFGFVPADHVDERLHLLRRDAGQDVYLDLRTGNEIFIARTSDEPPP